MAVDPLTGQDHQHIAIACPKLEKYEAAASHFETQVRVSRLGTPELTAVDLATDTGAMDSARVAQHTVQQLWRDIWAQLDAAREIARGSGRDTASFDEVRAAAREQGAG